MRTPATALLFALMSSGSVLAQSAPFDMTPEKPAIEAPAQTVTPPVSAPVSPPVTTTAPPAVPATPATPAPQPAADPTAAPTQAAQGGFKRYIVPASGLALSGELDARTWSVYLTPEQAAATAKLNLGYQNAIFVAPETSQLTIEINGTAITQEPIRSPDAVSELSFPIPAELLKPGANAISFRANQRHRTDCTVESTYELWSNIDSAKTYLAFETSAAGLLKTIDDIRAVGTDEKGETRFDFIAPALDQPVATVPLMRLAQGLAVIANMPNQSFTLEAKGKLASASGRMTVLIGTPAELQPLLPSLPAGAASAPTVSFMPNAATGQATLVITGPTWQAIAEAIESVVGPTEGDPTFRRSSLVTLPWRSPDAPLLVSNTRIAFSQFGIRTEEFSGRRLRTEFAIGVPSDFYADAYGEAVVLLDAGYSSAVLPGSHIDVYVNGSIAATVPITSSGGGILRHLPINVTMRHFRPGLNIVTLEAILNTADDVACVPGAPASDTPRFALFDTSEFQMPNFARIGQLPNLAAVAGTGFPYNMAGKPTPLLVDRLDSDSLSASATFLARLAASAGRPIALEAVASPSLIGDRNAIFIGSLSQMPQMVFTQVNIAEASRSSWGTEVPGSADGSDTQAAFDEWRSKVRSGSWTGQISAFEEWLKTNFDISLNSLRFIPAAEQSFTPPADTSLIIAQGPSPSKEGIWTLVAAPTGKALRDGMQVMSGRASWEQLTGHITTYAPATKTITAVPVTRFDFVETQPFSIANYRLIAANWLSTNILSYAVLLVVLAIVLGLATATLLGNLGRRH